MQTITGISSQRIQVTKGRTCLPLTGTTQQEMQLSSNTIPMACTTLAPAMGWQLPTEMAQTDFYRTSWLRVVCLQGPLTVTTSLIMPKTSQASHLRAPHSARILKSCNLRRTRMKSQVRELRMWGARAAAHTRSESTSLPQGLTELQMSHRFKPCSTSVRYLPWAPSAIVKWQLSKVESDCRSVSRKR